MAAVTLGKRTSHAEDVPIVKRHHGNPIGVTVLEAGNVQFDYDGKITQLSLVKLKEVSLYFCSFFSETWQEKSEANSTYELIKPDNEDFSPSLFMDLMHAYADPKVELEVNSMETLLKVGNLIQYYGFKGQFIIKNSHFFTLNYEIIKDVIPVYEELAQIIDHKRLAAQCCQVILDEPGFVDHCLFAPQARKFLSEETLTTLSFFDKIRNEITSLEIEVYDPEKNAEGKKSSPSRQNRTLHMTIPTASLEQFLSLFPNIQELKLKSKDDEWNVLVTDSYVIENHDNNQTIQMLNNMFLHHFKHLRTVTIPVKNGPPIVLKLMNNKAFILEFSNDENICIYQRSSDTITYKLDFIIGYQHHFPKVDETLIGDLLFFPPTSELLEGIDASRFPWTQDGKFRPGWGVHRPD